MPILKNARHEKRLVDLGINRFRMRAKKVAGLWFQLTEEQRLAALSYDGPINHGPSDPNMGNMPCRS